MNQKLYTKSIEVILQNQSIWGSYVASPSFPTYQYCWLRDGSFIAYAMDRVGQHESAAAFHKWVGNTIISYAWKVDEVEKSLKAGQEIGRDLILHTRFTLDGHEGTLDNTWGNFQVDGYGTWLWGLVFHIQATKNYQLLNELEPAISTVVRYLALTWKLPNYDCWEEHPEYLHPYSLACIFGGLEAINMLINEGDLVLQNIDTKAFAQEVCEFILRFGVVDGKLIKHIWPPRGDEPAKAVKQSGVDSSLLGMAFPFNVFGVKDPIMLATYEEIKNKLWRNTGGVYRYKADVYYGGGEWTLLTAWLGINALMVGEKANALKMLEWVERQADDQGNLPEQVDTALLAPSHYELWVKKWGAVASPLLWAHAMYIILYQELQGK
ncbi:MAG: glycoside hydrolase family 15 protein [Anaerolineaceae bacterium]